MSLIEDALKRAQEEVARQDEAQRRGKRPWIAPAPKNTTRHLGAAAGIAAIAVAAAAGTTFWILRHRTAAPAAAKSGPAAAAASPVLSAPAERAPAPLPPVREAVEVPPPAGTAKPVPEKVETPAAAPPAPKTVPTPERTSPSPAPPPAAAPPEAARPAAPPLRDGRSFVRVVALPSGEKIELEGIVYSDTNPVAVIGGRVLSPGAYVGDFRIANIEESRVTLTGNGITIYLTLF
jgi:hypothetical protein